MPPQYKFVEVAPVTDETLEDAVNEWTGAGWTLEGIRFVTTEHSKRPSMAFVSFCRDRKATDAAKIDQEPPRQPRPLVAIGLDRDNVEDDEPAVITAPHGTDVD